MSQIRRSSYRRMGGCAAVLCLAMALTACAQEWKIYPYAPDGFSASFPSEPELKKTDVPSDAGSFELRYYLAQAGQVALFVGVCDYGAAIANRNPDEFLQDSKTGSLEKSKSHLVSERPITLGIYHGLAYESENESVHFSARIYVAGTTLYQTLVVSPLGEPYPETARFLDSFQFIARIRN